MAKEDPGWGYTKIRDALWGLKHDIARSTVASILEEAGIEPEPERSRNKTWKQFLKSHWDTPCACDFFAVETLGVFGAVRHMVFFEFPDEHYYVSRVAALQAYGAESLFNAIDLSSG